MRTLIWRLSQISQANSYDTNISRIVRPPKVDTVPPERTGTVLQLYTLTTQGPSTRDGYGGNVFFEITPVQIKYWINPGIQSVPLDCALNTVRTDIQTCLGECGQWDDVMRNPASAVHKFTIDQQQDSPLYGDPEHTEGCGSIIYGVGYHYLRRDPTKWDDGDLTVSDNGLYRGELQ